MKFETLQKDMIAAMKARDKARKDAISTMVSAVKKLAIDEGSRDNITEELVDRALTKELRTAEDQVKTCPASRQDLLAEYQFRYDVIREYAPKMMTADEIKSLLEENYADALATGNKGQIMKAVMPALKGKADGRVIGEIVAGYCK